MQFRDIKPGNVVFLFDKNKVEVRDVKVINVSTPHYDSRGGNVSDMFVDVVVEANSLPYSIPERLETAYVGDELVIATSSDTIVNEVKRMDAEREHNLSMVDKWQADREKCKNILNRYSPEFKRSQENEQRIGKIESSIAATQEMLKKQAEQTNKLQEMLTKFINSANR